jgi:stringent starvation protein B
VSDKKELLVALLQHSWAYLQVDGRVDGVDLPDWLRAPGVTLQIGYDMPVPIPDLAIDDDGVTATLSFRRTPHKCRLPWRAIYAITDAEGRGVMFPDDVPADVATAPAPPEPPPAEPAPSSGNRKPRPSHLKLVP